MRVGCLLSVRAKATRLPGKVFLDIAGKPLTLRLLERLSLATKIDEIILCTSTDPGDDELVSLGNEENIKVYRGHPIDKLERYYNAALSNNLDAVVIVDGDDLFCFPEGIDWVSESLRNGPEDCVYLSGLPIGAASTGLKTEALAKVLQLKDEIDTEVWGGYFIDSDYFTKKCIHIDDKLLNHPNIRITIDYPSDYELYKAIINEFNQSVNFNSYDLMKLLTIDKPEIALINKDEQQQYLQHLNKSKPVKFKSRDRASCVLRSTFVIIGLGSMGKRRIRCLLSIGIQKNNIYGFDIRQGRVEEAIAKYGIKSLKKIDIDSLSLFSGIFICTPPDHHVSYAEIAVESGVDIFLEASVIQEGLNNINTTAKKRNLIVFPSCTMRYFEGPLNIKKIVESNIIGTPLCWQYQSGQYLPDWHPWENIDSYYVSNKETGGCREIVPFELSWIFGVFGKISEVFSFMGKVSSLDADIDDIYQIHVRHESGVVGQMTVEVLSRFPTRYIRITCTEGSVVWDDCAKEIAVFRNIETHVEKINIDSENIETGYINSENPYIKETEDFLTTIASRKQPVYSLDDDIEILNYLMAIESSAKNSKKILL